MLWFSIYMQNLTLPELKAACSEAGLSVYGNRDELLERLNAHAAAGLADVVPTEATDVVEDETMAVVDNGDLDAAHSHKLVAAGAVKMVGSTSPNLTGAQAHQALDPTPAIIIPTLADEQHLATRPTVAVAEVQRLVGDINTKYGDRMKATYNPTHETIDMTGGLQGKYCTTVHQPAANILNRDGIKGAADQYAKIAREALMHARTPQGAIGDISSMN